MNSPTRVLDLEASSSQKAAATDSTSLSFSSDMSVNAKIKLESLPTDGGDPWGVVGKATDAAAGVDTDWCLFLDRFGGNMYIRLQVTDSGGTSSENYGGPVSISTGTWYSIGGVFTAASGGNKVKMWFNGAQTSDNFTQNGATSIRDSGTPTIVGCHGAIAGRFLDGEVSSVVINSRALSSTEMESYGTTPCSFTPGANNAAYWTLDNVYTDSSGNGNTLTPANSPTFVVDPPFTCNAFIPQFLTLKVG